jgi:hypothetical protein
MPATPELCLPTRGNASVSSSFDSREGLWARWPRPQRRNHDDGRGDPMVRLVHGRILIQPGIGRDPVDEVVDHRGDVVDATEAVVQRRSLVGCIGPSNFTACEAMLGCRNRRRLCAGRLPTQPSLAAAQDRVNPSPRDRHGGAAGPAMPAGETFRGDGSAGHRQAASRERGGQWRDNSASGK